MSHETMWLAFKGHINTSLVMLSELNSPIILFLETPIVKTKTKLRTRTHMYARHKHVHVHAHTYNHRYIQRQHREERKRPTHIQTHTYKRQTLTCTQTHISHTQKKKHEWRRFNGAAEYSKLLGKYWRLPAPQSTRLTRGDSTFS